MNKREKLRKNLLLIDFNTEKKCEHCKVTFSKFENFFKHFTCNFCDKTYVIKKSLKRHLLTHYGIKFQCHYCQILCAQKHALKTHIDEFHSGGFKHKCSLCPKKFRSQRLVREHIRKHKLKFMCDLCSKLFTAKSRLNEHMVLHRGDGDFECQRCTKSFKCKRYLQDHVRFYHTNKKQFVCDKCDKIFVLKRCLAAHIDMCLKNVKKSQNKLQYNNVDMKKENNNQHFNEDTEKHKISPKKFENNVLLQSQDSNLESLGVNNDTKKYEKDFNVSCEFEHIKQEPEENVPEECWINVYDDIIIKTENFCGGK